MALDILNYSKFLMNYSMLIRVYINLETEQYLRIIMIYSTRNLGVQESVQDIPFVFEKGIGGVK